jgi:hypothetical protein
MAVEVEEAEEEEEGLETTDEGVSIVGMEEAVEAEAAEEEEGGQEKEKTDA